VIDGDTVRTLRGEVVRLLDIDAPERGRGARCPMEARRAERAAEALEELAARGLVLRRGRRDRYGRTLAEARTADGRSVAAVMILLGHARPYDGGRRAGWCG